MPFESERFDPYIASISLFNSMNQKMPQNCARNSIVATRFHNAPLTRTIVKGSNNP